MAKDSKIHTIFKDRVCPTPDTAGVWGKSVKPLSEAPEAVGGELGPGVQIQNVEGGAPGATGFGIKK